MSDPTEPRPALAPGDRVDRFDVVALLGEGGMARVYKVRHRTLGTLHALKLLHTEHGSFVARLVQEGRVQAHLDHPNVVAVTDVVELDHAVGLVMQYVEGRTLAQRLEEEGPLPLDEALRLFRAVLDGVRAAHEAGILHRDLKPANILLAAESDTEVPRIADFGLAKDVTGTHATGRTRAGLGMGTPGYAAPEQWADSSTVDVRTDVFALGAILYEMLVGEPPFHAETPVEVLERTVSGAYPVLEERVPGVPPRVDRAIRRALAPAPEARFPTVAAFSEALDGVETPPVGATILPPAAPPARRNVARMAGIAGTAGLGTLAAGAAAVILGGTLLWSLRGDGEPDVCHAWLGRVGYYNAGPLFSAARGDTHRLLRTVQVRRDLPREGNDWEPGEVRCTLPAGTQLHLRADPVRVRGAAWVPVSAWGITLPDDDPGRDQK